MTKTAPGGVLPHRGDESHLFREIVRTHRVLLSAFAAETGIPTSRFALMRVLKDHVEGIGITDLARRLEINPAAVTRQVKELESERLVSRRSDPKDARRSYIALSPAGWEAFEQIHERFHELERSIAEELGAENVATASRVLAGLRAFLEGHQ